MQDILRGLNRLSVLCPHSKRSNTCHPLRGPSSYMWLATLRLGCVARFMSLPLAVRICRPMRRADEDACRYRLASRAPRRTGRVAGIGSQASSPQPSG